ncbi:hypothetical protein IAR55_000526 [Kwoniella newhampshirensis]|uniref:Uncharacterized protein n=1 Tax=Kwoniella newhampshirensis TaxID=1651941 RepID=A0AAW0Z6W7_9TREE
MSEELYAQSYCGTTINAFTYDQFRECVARIGRCFAVGSEPLVEFLPLTEDDQRQGCPGDRQLTLFRIWPFTPEELTRVEKVLPLGSRGCVQFSH